MSLTDGSFDCSIILSLVFKSLVLDWLGALGESLLNLLSEKGLISEFDYRPIHTDTWHVEKCGVRSAEIFGWGWRRDSWRKKKVVR